MKKKCGSRFVDLTNKKFWRLLVIKFYKILNSKAIWIVKCDCGNITKVQSGSLNSGKVKSCGCLQKEIVSSHKMSRTRFYDIWRNMKQRCFNTKSINYSHYGGRGIKVCVPWLKFENFRDDMYESYLKHIEEFGEKNTSLDRIDVDENYEPSNCRWATREEQSRNTRVCTSSIAYDKHRYWKRKLSGRIWNVLNGYMTYELCFQTFGISPVEFKQFIESQFKKGMTWKNYGNDTDNWQIDHIIGCNNFDLSNEEDRVKCFHYTNLRPIWVEDHVLKSRLRKENGVSKVEEKTEA